MTIDFADYARQALGLAGVEVCELDLKIMAAAHRAYGPALAALDEADLTDVWPEWDLDPSRPPRSP